MKLTRVLVSQHRAIEALFEELANETRRNARVRLASRLAEELIAHMAAEEAVFYPAVRRTLGVEIDDHFMLRAQLRRVLSTSVHEPAFRARLEGLRLIFDHYAQNEETDLFPRIEAALEVHQLDAMGEEILDSRPPVWIVTTDAQALNPLQGHRSPQGVSLPAAR
jgi:hemerythrin superfamily protein